MSSTTLTVEGEDKREVSYYRKQILTQCDSLQSEGQRARHEPWGWQAPD